MSSTANDNDSNIYYTQQTFNCIQYDFYYIAAGQNPITMPIRKTTAGNRIHCYLSQRKCSVYYSYTSLCRQEATYKQCIVGSEQGKVAGAGENLARVE